jgi:hypothetical protein
MQRVVFFTCLARSVMSDHTFSDESYQPWVGIVGVGSRRELEVHVM